MPLSYRAAGPEDIEALYGLCRELIDRYEDTEALEYEKVLAWVRRKIETKIGQYTAVWREGQKLGYIRVCAAEGKLEVDDFYLLPPFRGQGYGKEILEHCIAGADTPVFLYVFVRNFRAVNFYARQGFRITGLEGTTRYRMQKG